MDRPTIIIDSREQEEFSFDPKVVASDRAALPAGDYSLAGLADRVAVERKSLDDFVSTVIHNRSRFSRELEKLRVMDFGCVVVEAGLDDVLSGDYRGGANPHSVFGAAVSIIADCGVPVFFCSNRQIACKFTQDLLVRLNRSFQKDGQDQEDPFSNQPTEGAADESE